MNLVSAKVLTVTGAYLRRRVAQMAERLHRLGMRTAHEVIDGYLLRATRSGKYATGLVIDPPGLLHALHPGGDERGDLYSLDPRDYFNSKVAADAIERGFDDVEPTQARYQYYPIGFAPDPNPPPGQNADPVQRSVRLRRAVVRTSERYCFCRLSVFTNPSIGEPAFDLVPASTPGDPRVNRSYATLSVLNSTNVSNAAGEGPPSSFRGYALSNASIDELAAGYTLIRESLHGYTSFEYPLCPPAALFIGSLMVAAIPVARQAGVGVADWGDAAVLLVGLDANPLEQAGSIVRWVYLWTPAEHPKQAIHPGPWVYKPDWRPTLNFSQWEEVWDGDPENVGSRPNWIDGLSGAVDGEEAVFRFRVVTLAGVPQVVVRDGITSKRNPTVPVEAIVELRIDQDGNVEAQYPAYEVFSGPDAFSAGGLDLTPYQAFVEGELPEDSVKVVWPCATLSSDAGLVRVDAEFSAPRDDTQTVAMPTWNGLMRDPDTSTFGLRVRAGDTDTFIPFEDAGAGLTAPSITINDVRYLFSACQSYKLWTLDSMVAMVSDTEVAVLVFEQWEQFSSAGTETRVLVVDVATGAYRLLPRVGYLHTETLAFVRAPVLSVIQREVKDDSGEIVQHGVYLIAGPDSAAVRITRDSGETWDDYLTFPRPAGGAYFLGNQLMLSMSPGHLIMQR
ncbi:hypothetical protein LJR071_003563 [Pseudomonas sp. LjRoot71]|uniref:hypothetical protein n=1 Tax=Pseudomonas sp. LjRoot71 TaxID=3342336 RepID=UPI003ECE0F1B